MTEFFNLGLAPIVRLPSDSENDRESLTWTASKFSPTSQEKRQIWLNLAYKHHLKPPLSKEHWTLQVPTKTYNTKESETKSKIRQKICMQNIEQIQIQVLSTAIDPQKLFSSSQSNGQIRLPAKGKIFFNLWALKVESLNSDMLLRDLLLITHSYVYSIK